MELDYFHIVPNFTVIILLVPVFFFFLRSLLPVFSKLYYIAAVN